MFARDLSVHQKCSNYRLTNLLFGLCKSVWVIDLLVTFPSPHPIASTCPSTTKVLRAKERALTLYLFIVFTFWIHSWIHQGVWGCVTNGVLGIQFGVFLLFQRLFWTFVTPTWMELPKWECTWESLGFILTPFVRVCFTSKHIIFASWALAFHI
jgi:hypothetical protein